MTGGKLNETARRQQEARKKRLAEALRANISLRKKRTKPEMNSEPHQTGEAGAALPVREND